MTGHRISKLKKTIESIELIVIYVYFYKNLIILYILFADLCLDGYTYIISTLYIKILDRDKYYSPILSFYILI